jgi:hypothetical protein
LIKSESVIIELQTVYAVCFFQKFYFFNDAPGTDEAIGAAKGFVGKAETAAERAAARSDDERGLFAALLGGGVIKFPVKKVAGGKGENVQIFN